MVAVLHWFVVEFLPLLLLSWLHLVLYLPVVTSNFVPQELNYQLIQVHLRYSASVIGNFAWLLTYVVLYVWCCWRRFPTSVARNCSDTKWYNRLTIYLFFLHLALVVLVFLKGQVILDVLKQLISFLLESTLCYYLSNSYCFSFCLM
jgi:hypothetical protein